jgi:hypothetical protein
MAARGDPLAAVFCLLGQNRQNSAAKRLASVLILPAPVAILHRLLERNATETESFWNMLWTDAGQPDSACDNQGQMQFFHL